MSDLVYGTPTLTTPTLTRPSPPVLPKQAGRRTRPQPFTVSPLSLADRMISLAQDADRAGYRDAAADLVNLVYAVLDQRAIRPGC